MSSLLFRIHVTSKLFTYTPNIRIRSGFDFKKPTRVYISLNKPNLSILPRVKYKLILIHGSFTTSLVALG